MAGRRDKGAPKRIGRRARWVRRGLLAAGLAASMLAVGPVAAQADTSAQAEGAVAQVSCGSWRPATPMALTSNHLLGVYLQRQVCTDHFNYKVAVHNYSSNGVGNRRYGVDVTAPEFECNTADPIVFPPAYVPPGGAWSSTPVSVYCGLVIRGVIYRPRTSASDPFVPEVHTICIGPPL